MRKFRFIGDPSHWGGDLIKNKVYEFDKLNSSINPKIDYIIEFPEDWEEVFDEPKKLHKDTDLGYFSLQLMKATIQSPIVKTSNEATFESFVSHCISMAKELIKQLDQKQ